MSRMGKLVGEDSVPRRNVQIGQQDNHHLPLRFQPFSDWRDTEKGGYFLAGERPTDDTVLPKESTRCPYILPSFSSATSQGVII